jgi:hypothetical protein
MNDAMRAGGIIAGGGVGFAVVLLAVRVGEDDTKVWFVLGGFMVVLCLAALAVVLLVYRHAMEARAAALALSAERSLISMRAIRTVDGVSASKPGSDFLGQLITSMNGADVVDGTTAGTSLAWPDDDKGD